MTSMRKTAIVTGGTSGIGLHAAKELKRCGFEVYTISRRENGDSELKHIAADITNEADVQRAVTQILQQQGRIDLLVNCAGFGISGCIEFTDTAAAKKQFEVNFFGLVNMTQAVLGTMRKQKSGRIVNISSVAAPAAIPFQAYYSCTKAAINDYTLALANEVRPYGITVCAVMPGDICTGFTAARAKSCRGDEEYGGRISRSVASMERDEENGMSPERAGKYVARVAMKTSHKPLYAIGFSYKAICVLLKLLPARLANYLVGLLYAK